MIANTPPMHWIYLSPLLDDKNDSVILFHEVYIKLEWNPEPNRTISLIWILALTHFTNDPSQALGQNITPYQVITWQKLAPSCD